MTFGTYATILIGNFTKAGRSRGSFLGGIVIFVALYEGLSYGCTSYIGVSCSGLVGDAIVAGARGVYGLYIKWDAMKFLRFNRGLPLVLVLVHLVMWRGHAGIGGPGTVSMVLRCSVRVVYTG